MVKNNTTLAAAVLLLLTAYTRTGHELIMSDLSLPYYPPSGASERANYACEKGKGGRTHVEGDRKISQRKRLLEQPVEGFQATAWRISAIPSAGQQEAKSECTSSRRSGEVDKSKGE